MADRDYRHTYSTSLRLALKRDIATDTFVIKRTVRYIRGFVLSDSESPIPVEVFEELLEILHEFLCTDEKFILQDMLATFTPETNEYRLYMSNVVALRSLYNQLTEKICEKRGLSASDSVKLDN